VSQYDLVSSVPIYFSAKVSWFRALLHPFKHLHESNLHRHTRYKSARSGWGTGTNKCLLRRKQHSEAEWTTYFAHVRRNRKTVDFS